MLPGKVVVYFLVLTIISVDPVVGGCCFGTKCTNEDKMEILNTCAFYLKKSNPASPPPRGGQCCQVVRRLQGNKGSMMVCILKLLTHEEKEQYDSIRILELKSQCVLQPSSASFDEVKNHELLILSNYSYTMYNFWISYIS
ncbi:hypothetical protein HU200_029416 [Digitaria exilis]|uniref:Bifunctional inhibitor/plant lipid transfer protein/seed storage helical domain-containing protein n=1 Tax=Digitaria exilis TaxID=1010633 RepID=A0A835BQX6_9POAL|nr:hypothetical protein HU200_029416 [Digitaria exilis]